MASQECNSQDELFLVINPNMSYLLEEVARIENTCESKLRVILNENVLESQMGYKFDNVITEESVVKTPFDDSAICDAEKTQDSLIVKETPNIENKPKKKVLLSTISSVYEDLQKTNEELESLNKNLFSYINKMIDTQKSIVNETSKSTVNDDEVTNHSKDDENIAQNPNVDNSNVNNDKKIKYFRPFIDSSNSCSLPDRSYVCTSENPFGHDSSGVPCPGREDFRTVNKNEDDPYYTHFPRSPASIESTRMKTTLQYAVKSSENESFRNNDRNFAYLSENPTYYVSDRSYAFPSKNDHPSIKNLEPNYLTNLVHSAKSKGSEENVDVRKVYLSETPNVKFDPYANHYSQATATQYNYSDQTKCFVSEKNVASSHERIQRSQRSERERMYSSDIYHSSRNVNESVPDAKAYYENYYNRYPENIAYDKNSSQYSGSNLILCSSSKEKESVNTDHQIAQPRERLLVQSEESDICDSKLRKENIRVNSTIKDSKLVEHDSITQNIIKRYGEYKRNITNEDGNGLDPNAFSIECKDETKTDQNTSVETETETHASGSLTRSRVTYGEYRRKMAATKYGHSSNYSKNQTSECYSKRNVPDNLSIKPELQSSIKTSGPKNMGDLEKGFNKTYYDRKARNDNLRSGSHSEARNSNEKSAYKSEINEINTTKNILETSLSNITPKPKDTVNVEQSKQNKNNENREKTSQPIRKWDQHSSRYGRKPGRERDSDLKESTNPFSPFCPDEKAIKSRRESKDHSTSSSLIKNVEVKERDPAEILTSIFESREKRKEAKKKHRVTEEVPSSSNDRRKEKGKSKSSSEISFKKPSVAKNETSKVISEPVVSSTNDFIDLPPTVGIDSENVSDKTQVDKIGGEEISTAEESSDICHLPSLGSKSVCSSENLLRDKDALEGNTVTVVKDKNESDSDAEQLTEKPQLNENEIICTKKISSNSLMDFSDKSVEQDYKKENNKLETAEADSGIETSTVSQGKNDEISVFKEKRICKIELIDLFWKEKRSGKYKKKRIPRFIEKIMKKFKRMEKSLAKNLQEINSSVILSEKADKQNQLSNKSDDAGHIRRKSLESIGSNGKYVNDENEDEINSCEIKEVKKKKRVLSTDSEESIGDKPKRDSVDDDLNLEKKYSGKDCVTSETECSVKEAKRDEDYDNGSECKSKKTEDNDLNTDIVNKSTDLLSSLDPRKSDVEATAAGVTKKDITSSEKSDVEPSFVSDTHSEISNTEKVVKSTVVSDTAKEIIHTETGDVEATVASDFPKEIIIIEKSDEATVASDSAKEIINTEKGSVEATEACNSSKEINQRIKIVDVNDLEQTSLLSTKSLDEYPPYCIENKDTLRTMEVNELEISCKTVDKKNQNECLRMIEPLLKNNEDIVQKKLKFDDGTTELPKFSNLQHSYEENLQEAVVNSFVQVLEGTKSDSIDNSSIVSESVDSNCKLISSNNFSNDISLPHSFKEPTSTSGDSFIQMEHDKSNLLSNNDQLSNQIDSTVDTMVMDDDGFMLSLPLSIENVSSEIDKSLLEVEKTPNTLIESSSDSSDAEVPFLKNLDSFLTNLSNICKVDKSISSTSALSEETSKTEVQNDFINEDGCNLNQLGQNSDDVPCENSQVVSVEGGSSSLTFDDTDTVDSNNINFKGLTGGSNENILVDSPKVVSSKMTINENINVEVKIDVTADDNIGKSIQSVHVDEYDRKMGGDESQEKNSNVRNKPKTKAELKSMSPLPDLGSGNEEKVEDIPASAENADSLETIKYSSTNFISKIDKSKHKSRKKDPKKRINVPEDSEIIWRKVKSFHVPEKADNTGNISSKGKVVLKELSKKNESEKKVQGETENLASKKDDRKKIRSEEDKNSSVKKKGHVYKKENEKYDLIKKSKDEKNDQKKITGNRNEENRDNVSLESESKNINKNVSRKKNSPDSAKSDLVKRVDYVSDRPTKGAKEEAVCLPSGNIVFTKELRVFVEKLCISTFRVNLKEFNKKLVRNNKGTGAAISIDKKTEDCVTKQKYPSTAVTDNSMGRQDNVIATKHKNKKEIEDVKKKRNTSIDSPDSDSEKSRDNVIATKHKNKKEIRNVKKRKRNTSIDSPDSDSEKSQDNVIATKHKNKKEIRNVKKRKRNTSIDSSNSDSEKEYFNNKKNVKNKTKSKFGTKKDPDICRKDTTLRDIKKQTFVNKKTFVQNSDDSSSEGESDEDNSRCIVRDRHKDTKPGIGDQLETGSDSESDVQMKPLRSKTKLEENKVHDSSDGNPDSDSNSDSDSSYGHLRAKKKDKCKADEFDTAKNIKESSSGSRVEHKEKSKVVTPLGKLNLKQNIDKGQLTFRKPVNSKHRNSSDSESNFEETPSSSKTQIKNRLHDRNDSLDVKNDDNEDELKTKTTEKTISSGHKEVSKFCLSRFVMRKKYKNTVDSDDSNLEESSTCRKSLIKDKRNLSSNSDTSDTESDQQRSRIKFQDGGESSKVYEEGNENFTSKNSDETKPKSIDTSSRDGDENSNLDTDSHESDQEKETISTLSTTVAEECKPKHSREESDVHVDEVLPVYNDGDLSKPSCSYQYNSMEVVSTDNDTFVCGVCHKKYCTNEKKNVLSVKHSKKLSGFCESCFNNMYKKRYAVFKRKMERKIKKYSKK